MSNTSILYSLYIVQCSDDTYYTGITNHLEKRMLEHNTSTKGAKYTRYRRPVTLVYSEVCGDKSSALKREYVVKQLKRKQKEQLWNYYAADGAHVGALNG